VFEAHSGNYSFSFNWSAGEDFTGYGFGWNEALYPTEVYFALLSAGTALTQGEEIVCGKFRAKKEIVTKSRSPLVLQQRKGRVEVRSEYSIFSFYSLIIFNFNFNFE
jgi:hypothetical protein